MRWSARKPWGSLSRHKGRGPVHAGPFFVQGPQAMHLHCQDNVQEANAMLVRVVRPYGGAEGRRVKVGTVFSVDKEHPGLLTITNARLRQLEGQKLVSREMEGGPAAPNAKPAPMPRSKPAAPRRTKVDPDGAPPPVRATTDRTRSRRKAQDENPKEPRPLVRRGGSPAGKEEQPASSSRPDPASPNATLKQRGLRRRGPAGVPLTTASGASPGRTSSTPATPAGGVTITPGSPPEPGAFD